MAFGNFYSTGLASVDVGVDARAVIGNGTLWGTGAGNARAGDTFEHAGIRVTIYSVDGDEGLTLLYDWPGATFTDEAYVIRQDSPTRLTQIEASQNAANLIASLRIREQQVAIFAVEEFGVDTPPVGYDVDEMLVVGTAPTGDFTGHANEIAQKTVNGWFFNPPSAGWITIDKSTTPHIARSWDATLAEWVTTGSLLGAPIWMGEWDVGTTYAPGSLVTRLNKIYAADRSTVGDAPESSPLDWTVFLTIGEHGGAPTIGYVFRTSVLATAADVAGQANLDAAPGSATVLRLNKVDAYGNDWATTLASLADGTSARLGRARLIVPGDQTRQWQAAVTAVVAVGDRFDLTLEADTVELGSAAFADLSSILFMWSDVGDEGAQGIQGDDGPRGFLGGPVNIPLTFSSTTADADPGPGNVRLGTATQNLATVARVDLANSLGGDITALLDALEDVGSGTNIGIGALVHRDTPETKYIIFMISAVAEPVGYRNFTISILASSAANPFVDGDPVAFSFVPIVQGEIGPTGATGPQGESFTPDEIVSDISGRAAFDAATVGTSVLVENDSGNGNKATLYFLLSTGPALWSEGFDFAPGAPASGLSYDDAVTALADEVDAPGGVTTVQEAIEALAEIARYVNAAEVDVAAASATDVFDTPDVNKRVTGTDTITGLGTGIGTRIVHWSAASPITHSATLVLLGAASRVNEAGKYSIFKSDGTTVTEIYYSGYLTPDGKNYADNPSFDVWQRGTSFAIAATTRTQVADRWKANRQLAGGSTVSRQTGFNGAQYCIRIQRDSGQTSVQPTRLWQQLLPPVPQQLQGKTLRLSFDVRAGANYSGTTLVAAIHTGTAGGEAADLSLGTAAAFATGGAFSAVSSAATPTPTAQRVVCDAFTVGSTVKDLAIRIQYTPSGTAGAADYIEITNVKLEIGGVATPFTPPSASDNLARCQYAYRFLNGSQMGYAATATTFTVLATINPPMRATPILALLSATPQVRGTGVTQTAAAAAITNSLLTAFNFVQVTMSGFAGMTVNAVGQVGALDWLSMDADILN